MRWRLRTSRGAISSTNSDLGGRLSFTTVHKGRPVTQSGTPDENRAFTTKDVDSAHAASGDRPRAFLPEDGLSAVSIARHAPRAKHQLSIHLPAIYLIRVAIITDR